MTDEELKIENTSPIETPLISPELHRNLSENCDRLLEEDRRNKVITGLYCEGQFDDWACWLDTPAGHTANQSCPWFIEGFDPTRLAYKTCLENGSWYMQNNIAWANYTTCVDLETLEWFQTITDMYKVGYIISLIALIISLGLFSYFKAIRCARIILHMNLFVSFTLNNSMWLVWYYNLENITHVQEKTNTCIVLHVILQYFMISNYMWMFCEGIYLHTVLVHAFISEQMLLRWLHALGWGLPLILVIPYTWLNVPQWHTACWTTCDENPYKFLLIIPVVTSIVLNILFLINIVRVLLVKLRAGPHMSQNSRPSQTAVQALRATLLLVPLLGLNFLLTPFRPDPDAGKTLIRFYLTFSAITQSFQGLCVTIIFCFCNGEVISQIKRKWKFAFFRPRANSFLNTTVSYIAGEKKINVKKQEVSTGEEPINNSHTQPQDHICSTPEKVNV